MLLCQFGDSLDFNNDLPVAKKVWYVSLLNWDPFIVDAQLFLCVIRYSAIRQLAFKTLLVDLFLESAAHLVVDFIDRTAYCIAFFRVYQFHIHRRDIITKKGPTFVQPRRGVFVCGFRPLSCPGGAASRQANCGEAALAEANASWPCGGSTRLNREAIAASARIRGCALAPKTRGVSAAGVQSMNPLSALIAARVQNAHQVNTQLQPNQPRMPQSINRFAESEFRSPSKS